MVQLVQANELTLHEVEEKFNLQSVQDLGFFPEWQGNLPELSAAEKEWLDQVKADFLSLKKYPLHEEIVKMAVLSPLLFLAGFFRHPFYPKAEVEVRIMAEDDGEIVRGRIDVLVLQKNLWVTVIESKNKQFSVEESLPQALSYMMSSSELEKPIFGFGTNGSHFIFIKLIKQNSPRYALSDEFSLNRRGNELYTVLSVLKRLGELATLE
jgi:hypothetical protein